MITSLKDYSQEQAPAVVVQKPTESHPIPTHKFLIPEDSSTGPNTPEERMSLDHSATLEHSPSSDTASALASSRGKWSLFKSCFGSSTSLERHATTISSSSTNHTVSRVEVGIRPSFYWSDATVREEADGSYHYHYRSPPPDALFMKNDCQDDVIVVEDFAGVKGQTFVGVFDGHGPHGRKAAKYVSRAIPDSLADRTVMKNTRMSNKKRLGVLKEACRHVQNQLQDESVAGFDASLSGTTACMLLVADGNVLLANTGDSRCVAARKTYSDNNNNNNNNNNTAVTAIQLTTDAKPSLPEESQRVYASGGIVRQLRGEDGLGIGAHRVFRRGDNLLPGLAMSRSLGDLYAHAVGVTWEPFLSVHALTDDDVFLVAGSDGIWDVMTNDEVVDFVNRYRLAPQPGVSCAEALTLEAQERWKAKHEEAIVDDISAAIVHISPLPPCDVSYEVFFRHMRQVDSEMDIINDDGTTTNAAAALVHGSHGSSSDTLAGTAADVCISTDHHHQMSLPMTHLVRAASCNDEANELAQAYKEMIEMDPSHHSPQRFFSWLYAEDELRAMGNLSGARCLSAPDIMNIIPPLGGERERGGERGSIYSLAGGGGTLGISNGPPTPQTSGLDALGISKQKSKYLPVSPTMRTTSLPIATISGNGSYYSSHFAAASDDDAFGRPIRKATLHGGSSADLHTNTTANKDGTGSGARRSSTEGGKMKFGSIEGKVHGGRPLSGSLNTRTIMMRGGRNRGGGGSEIDSGSRPSSERSSARESPCDQMMSLSLGSQQ
jgi:serine/threonine protein phosphatase PrpC